MSNEWVAPGENLEKAYRDKYAKLERLKIDIETINDIYRDSKCDEPL